MNKNLLSILNSFVNIMKTTEGVLGAWNFGYALHGMSDEYSDVDIVFLIDGNMFKKTEHDLSKLLSQVCDDILLCWEEDFMCRIHYTDLSEKILFLIQTIM
ncbi:MAG: hypothetical protein HDR12_00050 [Lachnospiraceae bacterium]|nr:hypothetical protein [Lachnospiraceae bacterium]